MLTNDLLHLLSKVVQSILFLHLGAYGGQDRDGSLHVGILGVLLFWRFLSKCSCRLCFQVPHPLLLHRGTNMLLC